MAIRHVIIGGGPAGVAAMETIRELDPSAAITLISDEPPHARMALPYWLARQIPEEQLLTARPEYCARIGVEWRAGRVVALDPQGRWVRLDDGTEVAYDRLLLATGSRPVRLPVRGADLPGVSTLWTRDDAAGVLAALPEGAEVCLIGAGFIGFIVLNALHRRGCRLSVVEQAPHVLPRMLDAPSAALVERRLAEEGIALYTGTSVEAIEPGEHGRKRLRLQDGRILAADLVLLATGVQPNVELAQSAGLAVGCGIRIDRRCRTSAPDVYAAGDCAEGPDLLTGAPVVHAIQPTAVEHGRVAGANMAGREVEYPGSLRMNVLEVAGLHCASYGRWDEPGLEAQVIGGVEAGVRRALFWEGDRIVGALFVGPTRDLLLLNDLGMVKGFIQTQAPLGSWKRHLLENPHDLRRPYFATGVPALLAHRTLLGRPARDRGDRIDGAQPSRDPGPHHAVFMEAAPGR